jgi:hypothetical protein
MGAAVTRWRRVRLLACGALAASAALGLAAPARAEGARYALVVSGASGSPQHAADHARWRETLVKALLGRLAFPADHVVVLQEGPPGEAGAATAASIRRAFRTLAARMGAGDLLLVVLIGHGTFDGVEAKFNLVGPDLEADEWRALADLVPGRLVFVNTASASAPFLSRLAGPRRVVITATATPAQNYDTVFPEFFTRAFEADESDLDKDGRVSIGEAFAYASSRVRRWYLERGQLATERALLDDTGDGAGKEAGELGDDGAVASRWFLDAGPLADPSSDPALSELLARRDALETALDELRRKREFMPAADYARELERLLVEHARVSRRIRNRS